MWWDFIAGLCLAGGGGGEELVSLAAPEGRALSCVWVVVGNAGGSGLGGREGCQGHGVSG